MAIKSLLVYLLASVPLGLAHPHGGGEREFKHAAQPWYRRSLSHCEAAFSEPEFVKRTVERHRAELRSIRQKRGLDDFRIRSRRQVEDVLNKDHYVDEPYDDDTPADELFKDAGACVLTPEVTEGPLYVTGEEVRRDITEGEDGVPMTINIQVVDVTTCEAVARAAVDFWSCNSTGVYGGVLDYPGNGDPDDLSLINSTVLRGVQYTDDEGMATFDALVPGHYEGRTTHVHAIAHLDTTLLPNSTITGGTVAHVGQLYFDQSLIDSVSATAPYSTNEQPATLNRDDFLLAMGAQGDDPVVRYTLVGDTLGDGIFAWIRFGVDTTADRPLAPAAYKDENGGHMIPGGGPVFPPFPPPPSTSSPANE